MNVRWLMITLVNELMPKGDFPGSTINYTPGVRQISFRVKTLNRKVTLFLKDDLGKGVVSVSVSFAGTESVEGVAYSTEIPALTVEGSFDADISETSVKELAGTILSALIEKDSSPV